MAERSDKTLEQRAQRAILQYAFFRPESALLIALTILLSFFAPEFIQLIPRWGWLLGGGVGEALLVYSSLTDVEAHRRIVASMLRDEFHPERLQDTWLQEQVREAFDYRSRITAAIRERRDSVLKDHLADTASQLDDWLEEVYGLAQRLDRYRKERALHERNREHARTRLKELEAQLPQETAPAVRRDIEYNLESLRRQIQTIEQLQNAMERARLRLENTLTAMSTIYTQTMLVGAKDIDSGHARRLRQEITEEVNELGDVLAAMDEVYAAEGQQ
ncbi:MAG TPA: hypothetical protein VE553_01640 [Candidatus Binatia bacterium]|jgi:predicted  nucleic acid-binding Zn-ribbon protein|nr:hypothetical protein [Candidatus Binatia bacterium]